MDIKQRLQSWDRDLKTFRIPEPSPIELDSVSFNQMITLPVLIREELNFEVEIMKEIAEKRNMMFTDSQRAVFNMALESVTSEKPLYMFIDARGGTGKTFILNAILAAVRCLNSENGGSVALATGTTGKASNLLHLGRTFHSRFKAVLSPHSESVCNVDAQSTLADLIRMAKIIIIDEAPMLHRYQLEALDRTLRDLTDKEEPFGGKSLIISGDFRQCLPVIPGPSRGTIVDAALNRSHLWKHFSVMTLMENMRIQDSGDSTLLAVDAWTLNVGNGLAETIDNTDLINIPEDFFHAK